MLWRLLLVGAVVLAVAAYLAWHKRVRKMPALAALAVRHWQHPHARALYRDLSGHFGYPAFVTAAAPRTTPQFALWTRPVWIASKQQSVYEEVMVRDDPQPCVYVTVVAHEPPSHTSPGISHDPVRATVSARHESLAGAETLLVHALNLRADHEPPLDDVEGSVVRATTNRVFAREIRARLARLGTTQPLPSDAPNPS